MQFKVGAQWYRLRIAPGLVELDGRRVDAATLEGTREILIAGTIEPIDRRDLLLRELGRAWTFEIGEPSTPQGWLDLSRTIAACALDGLALQGGEVAIMSLEPGESPQPMTARLGLGTSRECARCRGTVAGGSVAVRATGMPGQAELRLFCDHCGATQIWIEAVNARGYPMNVVLNGPAYERGDTTGLELPATV
jgi:hypothetical protein